MKKIIILTSVLTLFLSGCTSDKNIKEIKKATKLNEEQATKIFGTVQSIGFSKVDSAECSHHNTEHFFCTFKNYELFGESVMVNLTEEGNVAKISDYRNDLYKNGQVVANLFDYNITKDDFIYLVNNSKEKTKITLISPSTSVFPDWQQWGFSADKNFVKISGYTDSQNSFGAMIRTDIEFKYKKTEGYDDKIKYSFYSAQIGDLKIK